MPVKIIITAGESGRKLGDILRARGCSRRLLTRLKRTEEGLTCNGEAVRTIDIVREGDLILLRENDLKTLVPNPELEAAVLFENSEVVVFDKPAGMPVHPSVRHREDSLGNLFAARFEGTTFRPVNRLDRDTSGCTAAAKTQLAAASLQKSLGKVYYAVCCGYPGESGVITAPIAREADTIIRRCVREDGRFAQTSFEAVSRHGDYTLCRVVLMTGRTHQIRVHISHIGCPLAGDSLYGGDCRDITRQALHCGELTLFTEGREQKVISPLPPDIAALMHP